MRCTFRRFHAQFMRKGARAFCGMLSAMHTRALLSGIITARARIDLVWVCVCVCSLLAGSSCVCSFSLFVVFFLVCVCTSPPESLPRVMHTPLWYLGSQLLTFTDACSMRVFYLPTSPPGSSALVVFVFGSALVSRCVCCCLGKWCWLAPASYVHLWPHSTSA